MNSILSAIGAGYSHKQILKFLFRQYPHLKDPVEKAMLAGYTADTILKQLAGGRKEVMREDQPLTEHEQTRKSDIEKTENINKRFAQGALLAGGALAGGLGALSSRALMSRGTQAITGQVLPALPQQLQLGAPQQQLALPGGGIQPQPPQMPPNQPVPPQPKQTIPPTQNISPTVQPQTSPQSILPKIDVATLLKNKPGFTKKIEDLHNSGNSAEQIAGYFQSVNPSQTKALEKEIGKPIQEVISEYTNKLPTKQEIEGAKPVEIKKGVMALTPQGLMGNIQSLSTDKALIDVAGKIKQFKKDEIITSPIPEKELADLYEDVIGGIKKETGKEISRNVYWAGYDPKTNELIYIPHDGGAYIYDDISEEDRDQLTNFLTTRKSTGSNYIGAWEKGSESPMGAAMYQLIQKLQKERGGKGNEYKNKFLSIYDALEPAKKALKEKHAKAKKAKKPRFD